MTVRHFRAHMGEVLKQGKPLVIGEGSGRPSMLVIPLHTEGEYWPKKNTYRARKKAAEQVWRQLIDRAP